jgi:hypothetical protein
MRSSELNKRIADEHEKEQYRNKIRDCTDTFRAQHRVCRKTNAWKSKACSAAAKACGGTKEPPPKPVVVKKNPDPTDKKKLEAAANRQCGPATKMFKTYRGICKKCEQCAPVKMTYAQAASDRSSSD